MDKNKYLNEFGKPFSVDDISWKIQSKTKDGKKGMVVPFLDARAISNRLDEVVGQNNWKDSYEKWHTYTQKARGYDDDKIIESQLCTIFIYDEERSEWIGKTDGAENTDFESIKGGISDAFKRAAVKWNIGRYLYQFEGKWIDLEEQYGKMVIPKSAKPYLDDLYNKLVTNVFGVKNSPPPQNVNTNQQGKDAKQVQGNNPKQKAQNSEKQSSNVNPVIYEIKKIHTEGEGDKARSKMIISKGGNNSTVFMNGTDPKLKVGVKITNVQGRKFSNAYGNYSVLDSYEIAA